MSEFTNANSNSRYQIIIDISEQRLYLFEKERLKQSFPVSTSSFGEGSIENSFKTPLGLHQIKSKIFFTKILRLIISFCINSRSELMFD